MVWFVSHRTVSVLKGTVLKLEIVRILIGSLYYVWTYITENKTALFWVITQRPVSISYRRFEIPYWSTLKGSFWHLVLVTYRLLETKFWFIFIRILELSGNLLQTFRDNISVTSSIVILTPDSPFKRDPLGSSETPIRNFHYSLRNNPQQSSSHPLAAASPHILHVL